MSYFWMCHSGTLRRMPMHTHSHKTWRASHIHCGTSRSSSLAHLSGITVQHENLWIDTLFPVLSRLKLYHLGYQFLPKLITWFFSLPRPLLAFPLVTEKNLFWCKLYHDCFWHYIYVGFLGSVDCHVNITNRIKLLKCSELRRTLTFIPYLNHSSSLILESK